MFIKVKKSSVVQDYVLGLIATLTPFTPNFDMADLTDDENDENDEDEDEDTVWSDVDQSQYTAQESRADDFLDFSDEEHGTVSFFIFFYRVITNNRL